MKSRSLILLLLALLLLGCSKKIEKNEAKEMQKEESMSDMGEMKEESPKKEAERPGEVVANVKLKEGQLSHFRPDYFVVKPLKMKKEVILLGTVLASEENVKSIPARIPGRVEKVFVESTGSYIEKGQPVLEIYSPELITSGEEYILARKNAEKTSSKVFRDLLNASKQRLKQWGIKESQFEEWYREKKVPRSIKIYSPVSGVVHQLNAIVGKYVKEGEIFFKLLELSTVWVEMDVYEHDSAQVKLGQTVYLEFTALPDLELRSKLDFISPVLNPESRTLKVRTTIQNPEGMLKPGMIAEAVIVVKKDGLALVVPRSAIIDTGKRKVVWLKVDDQSFKAHVVDTGFESQGFVEITEGLNEGDEVVVEGNFLLDAQAKLFGGYEGASMPPMQM